MALGTSLLCQPAINHEVTCPTPVARRLAHEHPTVVSLLPGPSVPSKINPTIMFNTPTDTSSNKWGQTRPISHGHWERHKPHSRTARLRPLYGDQRVLEENLIHILNSPTGLPRKKRSHRSGRPAKWYTLVRFTGPNAPSRITLLTSSTHPRAFPRNKASTAYFTLPQRAHGAHVANFARPPGAPARCLLL